MADVTVLLTPRPLGGHEKALFGWLRDAVENEGLKPAIVGVDDALAAACEQAGLQRHVVRLRGEAHLPLAPRDRARWALARARHGRPLLLAPGALHAQAWLLAAALLRRHEVWSYVPMTYRASTMGWRHAQLRDTLLAPLLRRVRGWITIDDRQRAVLREAWGLSRPVHVLPNRARLEGAVAPGEAPAACGTPLRVAYVGRFEAWQKGLDWLADGIAANAPWAAGRHWQFQGSGPAAPRLQQLAAALGPQRVQVHAHAPLVQALARSDVLLLPSRFEGLPLVALEATALGRPVVATAEAGLDGLLPASSRFRFGDHAGLAAALASLATPAARAAAVAHAQARLPALEQNERYAANLRALVRQWRGQAPQPVQA
jgi:glycosyltransferase involved in cell wall biosynthesis